MAGEQQPERHGDIRDYSEWSPHAHSGPQWTGQQGRPAEHERGVLFQAPWEAPADGFAEHARRCARALAMAGCPVHLRSISARMQIGGHPDEVAVQKACADLLHASMSGYSVQVMQVVPTLGFLQRLTLPTASAQRVLSDEDVERFNRYRVISTVWERWSAPQQDIEALNRVGQCWTACWANAQMLEAAGLKVPLRVVPVPFMPDDPHLAANGRPQRTKGPVRFYHIGKWEPRKNQHEILGAFLRAFKPGEAEFYLKTSKFGPKLDDYPPGPIESLHLWLNEDKQVLANGWRWPEAKSKEDLAKGLGDMGLKVYQAVLPNNRLVAMHRHCDVYVTVSRGEGYDMPGRDAKLSGNLMVYGPSGGPQDFAGEADLVVQPSGRVPCHSFYGWNKGAEYLDYRAADIETAMRDAAERVRRGERVRGADVEPMSAARVGQAMLQNLKDVVGAKGKVF